LKLHNQGLEQMVETLCHLDTSSPTAQPNEPVRATACHEKCEEVSEYENLRAEAARWIYERKDGPMWWNWPVLTEHNPDPSSLKIPDTRAWNIFMDLASRGLLVPMVNDEGAAVYRLDLSKGSEWKRAMEPPAGWFSLHVWKQAAYGIRKSVQFVMWVISLVIAAWIGSLFNGGG